MQKIEFRKHRRQVLLMSVTPLLIIGSALWSQRQMPCGSSIEVSLGALGSWKSSQSVAMKRLSKELKRCSKANKITIWRSRTFLPNDFNHIGAFYIRSQKRLRDVNPETGDNDNWENVSEAAIHAVAARGGQWQLLAKFGAKHRYPYD